MIPNTFYRMCPSGYTCYEGLFPNPDDGLLSFDNFAVSLYVNLQIITQDQWDSDYQSVSVAVVFIIFPPSKYLDME